MTADQSNKKKGTSAPLILGGIAAAGIFIGLVMINRPQLPSESRTQDASQKSASEAPKPPSAATEPVTAARSTSPGFAAVKAKIEEVQKQGCTHFLHKPVGVKGTTAWMPRLKGEDDSPCLRIIAAGSPDKALSVSIWLSETNKIKEAEDSPPAPLLDYIYCAETEGLYSVNVLSPTDERYTFAAVDCPRPLSLKLLEEKKAARP